MLIQIEIPDDCTVGDLTTVAGAIFKASTEFVDWEGLYEGHSNAISRPGVVLLDISRQLEGSAKR